MKVDIIGVDCAVQARNVGLARGVFKDRLGRIEKVALGSTHTDLVATVREWIKSDVPTLIALDAPLGWPLELGSALRNHQAGDPVATEPNRLFRRKTDRFIRAKIGKQPLDVGADRIARTAHAALRLLDDLRERIGESIPLAWEPTQLDRVSAIEVYPAATLLAHGIHVPGYKRKDNQRARRTILARLGERLEIPIDSHLIERNDDALDAVLCVLAGLDFLSGEVYRPEDMEAARIEGWIWVRKPVLPLYP